MINMPKMQVKYFTAEGVELSSPNEPGHYYTVVNGVLRTRRDGPPQKLVDGEWIAVAESAPAHR